MIETMTSYLDLYSKPLITYIVRVVLYADIPSLYQSQLVIDRELKLTEWRKVVARTLNYSDISQSTVIFEDVQQNLIDLLNQEEDY